MALNQRLSSEHQTIRYRLPECTSARSCGVWSHQHTKYTQTQHTCAPRLHHAPPHTLYENKLTTTQANFSSRKWIIASSSCTVSSMTLTLHRFYAASMAWCNTGRQARASEYRAIAAPDAHDGWSRRWRWVHTMHADNSHKSCHPCTPVELLTLDYYDEVLR